MLRHALALAGLTLATVTAMPVLAAAPPTLAPSDHVTVCHATGSARHPFVMISPSAAGVVNGHLNHQDQRDVVPPFTFRGQLYAQNWTSAGQTLLANGCTSDTGGSGVPGL